MRIVYHDDNDVIGAPVRAIVDKYASRIAPTWCRELRVFPDTADDPETFARISSFYGYRFAKLYLSKKFGDRSHRDQHEAIMHEMFHLHLAPMQHVAEHLAGTQPTKMTRTLARAELEIALEASVQDVTELFMSLHYHADDTE